VSVERQLAPAKLTLTLRVTGVRADGYHLIDAEMVTLDLADELTFTPTAPGTSPRLVLTGPHAAGLHPRAPPGRQRDGCGGFAHARPQRDAVGRADRQAFLAAGAVGGDHGVELGVRADDRIGRADLQAQRAADAVRLVDQRDGR